MNYSAFLRLFEKKSLIFFAGIGGISMSAVARMAKNGGCRVRGYDLTKTALTEGLEKDGIPVSYEFCEKDYEGVALVVYTGALRKEDPVLAYPRGLGIPFLTRAEFLGFLMQRFENPVGVAGTHGKSTTSGMLTEIFLADTGRDPQIMIGAEMNKLGGTYRLGQGKDFLFEACEYQDSFLQFCPHIAVILNVEHDHADYFPTLDDVINSFVRFADLAEKGHAVINYDSENARRVAQRTRTKVLFFSQKEETDVTAKNLSRENGFWSFDLRLPDGSGGRVALRVPGKHNVSNALAAAGAAFLSGVPVQAILQGLGAFTGVKRRFEYRGKCGDCLVFDDYAHHPDEIRATLTAAREMGYKKVTVVYQPHTFSRTQAYFNGFVEALSLADEAILMDIYPAREKPIPGITSAALANAIPGACCPGTAKAIAEKLLAEKREGIVLVMGAGDIIHLTDRILTESAQ